MACTNVPLENAGLKLKFLARISVLMNPFWPDFLSSIEQASERYRGIFCIGGTPLEPRRILSTGNAVKLLGLTVN